MSIFRRRIDQFKQAMTKAPAVFVNWMRRRPFVGFAIGFVVLILTFFQESSLRDDRKDARDIADSQLADYRLRYDLLTIHQQLRALAPASFPIDALSHELTSLSTTQPSTCSSVATAPTSRTENPDVDRINQLLLKWQLDEDNDYQEVIQFLTPYLTSSQCDELKQQIENVRKHELDAVMQYVSTSKAPVRQPSEIIEQINLDRAFYRGLANLYISKAQSSARGSLKGAEEQAEQRFARFDKISKWLYLIGCALVIVGRINPADPGK